VGCQAERSSRRHAAAASPAALPGALGRRPGSAALALATGTCARRTSAPRMSMHQCWQRLWSAPYPRHFAGSGRCDLLPSMAQRLALLSRPRPEQTAVTPMNPCAGLAKAASVQHSLVQKEVPLLVHSALVPPPQGRHWTTGGSWVVLDRSPVHSLTHSLKCSAQHARTGSPSSRRRGVAALPGRSRGPRPPCKFLMSRTWTCPRRPEWSVAMFLQTKPCRPCWPMGPRPPGWWRQLTEGWP